MPCLFAGNRRARWNFSGRERGKGIFLEITTGTLREKRPSRRRRRRRTEWEEKGEPRREREKDRGNKGKSEEEGETSGETGQPARKRNARH